MIKFICDGGCGYSSTDKSDFTPKGYVIEKIYCSGCFPEIEILMKEIDSSHTKYAGLLESEIKKIRDKWKKKNSKGTIPDEA